MLAATLALSITGCTQPEDAKEEQQLFAVRFDANAVTCKNGAKSVSPDEAFEAGTKLTFMAKLSAGKAVAQWTVNGTAVPASSGSVFTYTVRAPDAKDEGGKKVILVAFTEKAAEKITVRFDAAKLSCKNGGAAFSSGSEAAEGTKLSFTAILPAGKTVERWMVNGAELQDTSGKTLAYEVKAVDAKTEGGKKSVTISFTQKDLPPSLHIAFDGKKVMCYRNAAQLRSGAEIKEGDVLAFAAKTDAGKAVAHWTLNGAAVPDSSGAVFTYTVKAADAKSVGGKQVIAVVFVEKEAEKITVNFDESKIYCYMEVKNGPPKKFRSGSEHLEGTYLGFGTRFPVGKTAAYWIVNGTAQKKSDGKEFGYILSAAAAKDEGGKKVITVDFAEKEKEKITVKFDESKINCYQGEEIFASGMEVNEGNVIQFSAKLSAGETVDHWLFNGTENPKYAGERFFRYTVKASDAKDEDGKKVIELTLVKKAAEKITVKFNESKITCLKGGNFIASGTEVEEGIYLYLTTVLEGKNVKDWLLNGIVQRGYSGTRKFPYRVKTADSKDEGGKKVIEIALAENISDKIAVMFDAEKIRCYRNAAQLRSGAEIKEGDVLTFAAELPTGKAVAHWTLNGAAAPASSSIYFEYTVKAAEAKVDGGKQVIAVAFVEKEAEKITVKFDESKISCFISTEDGSVDVPSGSERFEGTYVWFNARLPEGKTAAYWIINGTEQKDSTGNEFGYLLSAAAAKTEGGKKVITADFVEKAAEKIVIRFDESKIKCFDGKDVASGKEFFESDVISFTAKLSAGETVDRWLFNGKENPRYPGESFFWYTVKASDAKDEGGKKVIELTLVKKAAEKIIVKFDESKISCRKNEGTIASGTEVNGGVNLYFNATLSAGKLLKDWRINDAVQEGYAGRLQFSYTVKTADAKDEGGKKVITVDFTEKEKEKVPEKITVKFNESKIRCREGGASIASGTEVEEGVRLSFNAEHSEGKTVKDWRVNDTVQGGSAGWSHFSYTVKSADAKEEGGKKVLEIAFTEKVEEKITVIFDESKIRCRFIEGGPIIASGSALREGDAFVISALLPEGKGVERWYINGEELRLASGGNLKPVFYRIPVGSAKTITITFTEKTLSKIIVCFDSARISAQRDNKDKQPVHSGDVLYEGESIRFSYGSAGFDETPFVWRINGKQKGGRYGNFFYVLNAEDAKQTAAGLEITVSFTE